MYQKTLSDGIVLREITGYDGKYWASSSGHVYVYSVARVNAKRPTPFRMAEYIRQAGYHCVTLIGKQKHKPVHVHVVVCAAWNGPKPSSSLCVRHLDGDKSNNRPDNLAWGTYAENEADKKRHGTAAVGAHQGSAKLTDEGVRIIRASIPFGLWNVNDAAQVFGVTRSTIRRIARGVGWQHVEVEA